MAVEYGIGQAPAQVVGESRTMSEAGTGSILGKKAQKSIFADPARHPHVHLAAVAGRVPDLAESVELGAPRGVLVEPK